MDLTKAFLHSLSAAVDDFETPNFSTAQPTPHLLPTTDNEEVLAGVMGVFSDKFTHVTIAVNLLVISTAFSLLGVLTNVINIMVFLHQGFQEMVDLNLFAIAFSDMCICATQIWTAVCFNPLLVNSDSVQFLSMEVEYLTGGGPHQMALNFTAWLTAIVTFERCICVALPLKVKTIITKPRIKVVILIVFAFMVILPSAFIFSSAQLGWKFVPHRNKTMLGLVFTRNDELMEQVIFFIFSFSSPILTFSIVVVCTSILTVQLWQQRKWRLTTSSVSGTTTNDKKDDTTAKEKKLVKMVVLVAAIFIAGYSPSVFLSLWMAKDPEFRISGKYANNYKVAISFAALFESFNASINIFVYYRMSSKYRLAFQKVFCKRHLSL